MTTYKSKFLETLNVRGFIDNCTDFKNLDSLLSESEKNNKPIPLYIGFDCTATSLHVGSMIQIMTLRIAQQCGHKPIILMGGGTTKIGDPSGKDESRKMLSDDDIRTNMESIKTIFSNFIKISDEFDSSNSDAIVVNNNDWLSGLNYIEFLRDYGILFSVNKMLSRESVKIRLEKESHLSFLEFNYMILQAYDFYELNRKYSCRLQIGGSDQWGNIVGGIELCRKLDTSGTSSSSSNFNNETFGLTTPLITTASGGKMGKTAQGAVWLKEDMLSAYDYWQFWRNTEDADVSRFLRFFTDLSEDEIIKLENAEGVAINESKIALANAATSLCHCKETAEQCCKTAKEVFEKGGVGAALPEYQISKNSLDKGIAAYKLFAQSGIEKSGGGARRLIQGGGAKINDKKIIDAEMTITSEFLDENNKIKLSAGKKRHLLIVVI